MLPDPAQGRSFPPRPARWDESADPDSTGGLEYGSDIAKPEGRCHSGSGDSPRGSAACYVGTVPTSTRTETQIDQPDQHREGPAALARRLPPARVHELVDLAGGKSE